VSRRVLAAMGQPVARTAHCEHRAAQCGTSSKGEQRSAIRSRQQAIGTDERESIRPDRLLQRPMRRLHVGYSPVEAHDFSLPLE